MFESTTKIKGVLTRFPSHKRRRVDEKTRELHKRFTKPGRMTILELEKLPNDILIEIFVRLPSQSIFSIQSVCKNLCKIVDTHLFKTLHKLSAPAAAAEVPRLMITIQSDYPDRARLKGFSNTLQLLKYDPETSSLSSSGDEPSKGNRVHHSCFLFNPLPLTGGEVVVLPSVPEPFEPFSWYGMGMGSHHKSNTFKIKIVGVSLHPNTCGLEAYIYELGTSTSWRQIPSVPPQTLSSSMGVSAFGNMFYWFIAIPGRRDSIISFDFIREEFSRTPHPVFNGGGSNTLQLLNLRGSLAAIDIVTPSNHIEIWVLTHPNKEWTLDYKVQRDVCLTGPDRGRLRHCGEWEHGLFFVEYHAKWGEMWSDAAIFLDLRCGGSTKRVFFPEEFKDRRQNFNSAGKLFSFTGSTLSLKHYGNLLEAKEGE